VVTIGISVLAAIISVFVLLIYGKAYFDAQIYSHLHSAVVILIVVCIVILSPLCLFDRTRMIAVYGFTICSFAYGLATWLVGLVSTYIIWGKLGITVGLLLGGVGVVPLGIVASMLHADWLPVAEIVIGLVLTFASHFLGLFLASKMDQENVS
jgi:hypothetical protein